MGDLPVSSADERIERFLSAAEAPALRVKAVRPVVGDASTRAYYRLELEDGESAVLVLLPEPFDASQDPFLSTAELFRAIPLRVPEVHYVSGEDGVLVLEDLGDDLLQDVVGSVRADRKRELYLRAVDILVRLQKRGEELRDDRYVAFRTAFDEEKFFEELDFFREHFLSGLRGGEIEGPARRELEGAFRSLSAELAAQPYALCHRDYHARNLMLVSDELAVIDFQDARMGPRSYDLVSVLNDSYVRHSSDLVEELKEVFGRAVGYDVSEEYDLAALQRNLKALGTFGFQITERGKVVYEPYVGPTLSLVRANLERNPRFDALRAILAHHLEELA